MAALGITEMQWQVMFALITSACASACPLQIDSVFQVCDLHGIASELCKTMCVYNY